MKFIFITLFILFLPVINFANEKTEKNDQELLFSVALDYLDALSKKEISPRGNFGNDGIEILHLSLGAEALKKKNLFEAMSNFNHAFRYGSGVKNPLCYLFPAIVRYFESIESKNTKIKQQCWKDCLLLLEHGDKCLKKTSEKDRNFYIQEKSALFLQYAEYLFDEKDDSGAFKYLHKAANDGNVAAQSSVGWCLLKGIGTEQNSQMAVHWYKKAAEQNHPTAQNNLGWCLLNGIGIEKNKNEAVYWLKKAAKQGEKHAQQTLKTLNITY